MEQEHFDYLKKLVHAAIDIKTNLDLRHTPELDTIEKIASRDLRALDVHPSQVDGIWTVINLNIKTRIPGGKRVEAKERKGAKTAGDIWKKACAANGVDTSNRPTGGAA